MSDPMSDERLEQIRSMVAGLEPYVSIPADSHEWHYAVKDLLAEVDRARAVLVRVERFADEEWERQRLNPEATITPYGVSTHLNDILSGAQEV